jgi:signal transduction histidine kinase
MRPESLVDICSASIDIWMNSGVPRRNTVRMTPGLNRTELMILADSRRLQQVLLNIFDNASQHSPEGSEITVLIEKTGGALCRLRVIDRGSGIAADILARIFEPFFSTRPHGTGLGMSIVKHIIEAHGGGVSVMNNQPPPGCSVEIRLPVAASEKQ